MEGEKELHSVNQNACKEESEDFIGNCLHLPKAAHLCPFKTNRLCMLLSIILGRGSVCKQLCLFEHSHKLHAPWIYVNRKNYHHHWTA